MPKASESLDTLTIKAAIEPVPFARAATNGKRRYNPKRYTSFKQLLGYYAREAMNGRAPLTGAIKLSADFFKQKPKSTTSIRWGDGDNHLKAVMDALQGICYENDAQIVAGAFKKHFGEPHIIITLEEI